MTVWDLGILVNKNIQNIVRMYLLYLLYNYILYNIYMYMYLIILLNNIWSNNIHINNHIGIRISFIKRQFDTYPK